MPEVTNQVRRTVRDAAYIAVGVGVLGAQSAQEKLGATAKDVKAGAEEGARTARLRLETLADEIRERVEPVLAKLEARVEPIRDSIEARVEPVVDTARLKAKQWLSRGKAPARKAA
jgi:heterodisulfide reductase subunit B